MLRSQILRFEDLKFQYPGLRDRIQEVITLGLETRSRGTAEEAAKYLEVLKQAMNSFQRIIIAEAEIQIPRIQTDKLETMVKRIFLDFFILRSFLARLSTFMFQKNPTTLKALRLSWSKDE